MGSNITVIIQTHNEEANLASCIESVMLFTDSILVIDTESTDKTVEIARQYEVQVLSFPFSRYVEPARQFGIEKASTDWVFFLDADERIGDRLAAEIKQTVASQPFTHYKIPRQNIFGNKRWLKHGGWWPDHQTRLIYKPSFKEWPSRIHSTPVIEGTMGYLQNPFQHYFHGDVEKMVEKTIIYEDVESELLAEANRDVSTPVFFRKFIGEFFRRFVKKTGFMDGNAGVLESVYQAFSKTITWLFLYEKKKSRTV
jgi:glycosyltransferase involved in cell wall biosynthesis